MPADDRPPSTTLPAPLTSFIGRDSEIGDVLSLLDDDGTRLLTMMGAGGVGKTRLCLEVARRVEHDFADGAAFIPLAAIRDPELILHAIAKTAGVQERDDQPLVDSLVAALRDRHLLLVLDNFEHLLATSPLWLSELLGRCPRLKVLVTSRIALRIGGEQRYLVSPMPMVRLMCRKSPQSGCLSSAPISFARISRSATPIGRLSVTFAGGWMDCLWR